MIQAIETRYKGYRFRSRLEARWAVFFDAMGEPWQYEPEGFILPTVGPYLPDFYLPNMQMYVEIKPPDGDKSKAEEFGMYVNAILLLSGTPGDEKVTLFCDDVTDSGGGFNFGQDGWLGALDGKLIFVPHDTERTFLQHGMSDELERVYSTGCCSPVTEQDRQRYQHIDVGPVIKASDAARSARFERGETPQIYIEPKYPLTGKPDEEFLRLCDAARFADPHEFDQLPKSKPAN